MTDHNYFPRDSHFIDAQTIQCRHFVKFPEDALKIPNIMTDFQNCFPWDTAL